jgi:hypothetical protein
MQRKKNYLSDERTTVSIPRKVRNDAKNHGINISKFCREALIRETILRIQYEDNIDAIQQMNPDNLPDHRCLSPVLRACKNCPGIPGCTDYTHPLEEPVP